MTKVAVEVEGWNAEAAIGFALAAKKFASAVTLSRGRETADGKDEVDVLTLGPDLGDEVLLEVEGMDEKDAFKTLLARLLSIIEPPKERLAAVIGPETVDMEKTARLPRRRVAEVAALDVEEVVPVRLRHLDQGYEWRRRRDSGIIKPRKTSASPRKKQKHAHRKPASTARKKLTTTPRKPRKPKK